MSQIAHSQLALKKRNTAVIADAFAVAANRKSNGHNDANGQKNQNNDKNTIVIDDDYAAIPVSREEEVASPENMSPIKKKRGRKSKHSTDSRDSSEFIIRKIEETTNEAPKTTETDPVQIVENLPTPEQSPRETKVIELTADALASKRRLDRLQDASTIVNLSSDTLAASEETTLSTDTTERRVSGRRSTRPMDEIKFSYRSSNADDSLNATTNATIGSERSDSILETPTTDRKRRIDSEENIESPIKRSRLDLSALFNNFYSPVSILRNKFRRANLASTPRAGILDDSNASIDTSTSEMKEIDLNEIPDDNEENKIGGVTVDDDDYVKIIVKPIKKPTCSIM